MNLSDACSDFLNFMLYEKGASKHGTVAQYKSWLNRFQKYLISINEPLPHGLSVLNVNILRRYMYHLSEEHEHRPRTIRSAFVPLKGLVKFLIDNKAISIDNKAISDDPFTVIKLPRKDAAIRLLVSDEECMDLLSSCDRMPDKILGVMTKAILSCVIYTGLRAQELTDLKVTDYSLDSKTLLIRDGKGGKSRILYPNKECQLAIEKWLRCRVKANHDWMWRQTISRRYSDDTLRELLEGVKTISGYADLPNIKFHSIRHRFATRMMENGATIKQVQAALGHTEPQTTFTYLHMDEDGASAMTTLSSIPGHNPKPEPDPVVSNMKLKPYERSLDRTRNLRNAPLVRRVNRPS